MKIKKFQDLLSEQLDEREVASIKRKARIEMRVLRMMQLSVKNALASYMKKHKIGFNEVVKRLHSSPDQVSKIQKCEANLTIASIAHISAFLENEPTFTFKKKS